MSSNPTVDPRLDDFVLITEVAEGTRLAEPVFRCKYDQAAPSFGHHVLALCRCGAGWVAGSYINYLPFEGAMLVGGACTDGRVLALLDEQQRNRIEDCGGLMLQAVRYAEARFADRSIGTFGHCGDARSWSVLQQCGYRRLAHPHLIVRWNREPERAAREELIAAVSRLGEF